MSERKTDILFKAQTMKNEARFMTKRKTKNLIETNKSYLNLFLVYLGINGLEI